MRISHILPATLVDGPGLRTAIYFQGCTLACPGCQNPHLWNPLGGTERSPAALAADLLATGLPITLIGGEPLQQPLPELAALVRTLKHAGRHIILYSGYTFEEIVTLPGARDVLASIDVLVDGRFIWQDDDPFVQYRGSRNQRVLDMPETLRYGGVPIQLDWDTAEIVIDAEGDVVAAEGVALDFAASIGALATTRRCGDARRIA